MIKGIGLDLVEIARMEKNQHKDYFLKRVFTEKELEYCSGFPARLAGNFAVKEAVAKAFGIGFTQFGPIDVEVLRDEKGCPYVRLSDKAAKVQKMKNITFIYVTITNEGEYAAAMAVAEG